MATDDEASRLARALELLRDTALARSGRAKLTDLAATLDGLGFTNVDKAAVLASGGRLGVYRALVRNNLGNTVFRLLPRTRALVNAALDDAFDDDFVAFLESPGPRAPLLRDVVLEARDALERTWSARSEMPPWARELLALEAACFAADVAEGRTPITAVPSLDANLRLALAAGAALFTFTHDVVAARDADPNDTTPPTPGAIHVAVSRDAESEVHVTRLDARSLVVARSLGGGSSLAEAVMAAGPSPGADGDVALASALATLAARGLFAAP